MDDDFRKDALKLLSDIDQQIAAVDRLTVEPINDEVLQKASAMLPDLRVALERVERMLQ